jgi:asparaginyl-tRNA synthetase
MMNFSTKSLKILYSYDFMIQRKELASADSRKMRIIMKIQHKLLNYISDFHNEREFLQCIPPIIGPATDPGTRGARKVAFDYYGATYYVMSSAILYKQALVTAFCHDDVKGIWFFSPNLRLEPLETAKTGRHLTEFMQVDVEMPHASYEEAMIVCEEMLCYLCRRVGEECGKELDSLSRQLEVFFPFPRMTHHEVVEMLRKEGCQADYESEIPWEGERRISEEFESPFFIMDYPKGSRGFYDRMDPKRVYPDGLRILRDFDMLYPAGFGEAASGAEREYEYETVLHRMSETGENPSSYAWYMDMLKEGILPSAGFGIGVERLTRFICGLESIAHARPFAKVAGVFSP